MRVGNNVCYHLWCVVHGFADFVYSVVGNLWRCIWVIGLRNRCFVHIHVIFGNDLMIIMMIIDHIGMMMIVDRLNNRKFLLAM